MAQRSGEKSVVFGHILQHKTLVVTSSSKLNCLKYRMSFNSRFYQQFFTFQFSSESTSGNPFRDGGKLSRDAQDIVDAVKTGKLSTISNVNTTEENCQELGASQVERESLVKPIIRKNAVIETVPRSIESKKNVKAKQGKCCLIL